MNPSLRADSDTYIPASSHCLNAGGIRRQDYETETLIAHSLRGEGFDASEDGTGRGTPLVPVAIQERAVSENPDAGPQGKGWQEDVAFTLEARNKVQSVAFGIGSDAIDRSGEGSSGKPGDRAGLNIVENCQPSIRARTTNSVATSSAVRRLTPRECERLMGFPDDFTLVPNRGKPMADGPRYKMLGNSMAVPVLRWIGERIAMVDQLSRSVLEAAA